MNLRPITIFTFAAGLVFWVQTPVFASFYKTTGVRESTGIPYIKLSVLSDDKRASLGFICDEGGTYPRMTFKRKKRIMKKGDPFKLQYMNDKGFADKHNFLTLDKENIGRFFIRHTQLYAARFGDQPTMFKPGTASFSDEYINWDAHIRQTVLHDMVDGDFVDITIWDESGLPDAYHFNTKGFRKFFPLLENCLALSKK